MDERSTERQDRVLTLVAVLGCGALALGMRLPWLAHGYSSDEVGLLVPGDFVRQFLDPETGVNPPMYRWLLLAFPRAAAMVGGRWISLLANVGAVMGIAAVGRVVAGRWWGALLAGLLLAVHPPSIDASTSARAYGLWSLAMAAHLGALVAWARSRSREAAVAVAVTALILPWIHYFSVPWMLVVGLGVAATVPELRALPLLYAPAAVAFLPLLQRILTQTVRREPPAWPVGRVLDLVVGMGLSSRALPQLRDGEPTLPTNPSLPALVVVAAGLLCLLSWRRLPPASRVLTWAMAAVPVAVAVLATRQAVRPPTAMMMATLSAAWLAAAVSIPTKPWLRGLLALSLAAPLAWATVDRLGQSQGEVHERDAVREVAMRLSDGRFPPGSLSITPASDALPMFYYLTGRYISDAAHGGPCGSDPSCFAVGERAVRVRDVIAPGETPWVVVFGPKPKGPAACAEVERLPGALIMQCGTHP
jgi:hypothetical protein